MIKDKYLQSVACKDLLSLECFQKIEYFDINGILNQQAEESEEEDSDYLVFTSVDS